MSASPGFHLSSMGDYRVLIPGRGVPSTSCGQVAEVGCDAPGGQLVVEPPRLRRVLGQPHRAGAVRLEACFSAKETHAHHLGVADAAELVDTAVSAVRHPEEA